jgi:hypothetical protein
MSRRKREGWAVFEAHHGSGCDARTSSAAIRKDEFAGFRFDALEKEPGKEAERQPFRIAIAYPSVSQRFPPVDARPLAKSWIRAILVQGYPSRTYPSDSETTFARFRRDAYAAGILIVLVSHYGALASQHTYPVSDLLLSESHMLSLYAMIGETALPLLSLVVSAISTHEWNAPGNPAQVVNKRTQPIRRGVNAIFRDCPNHPVSRVDYYE